MTAYANPRILERYRAWDAANPAFYPMFCHFTRQMIAAGHKKLSSKLIFERIRWETLLQTRGDRYKLNDHYTAVYARRFMDEFPDCGVTFNTRVPRP